MMFYRKNMFILIFDTFFNMIIDLRKLNHVSVYYKHDINFQHFFFKHCYTTIL